MAVIVISVFFQLLHSLLLFSPSLPLFLCCSPIVALSLVSAVSKNEMSGVNRKKKQKKGVAFWHAVRFMVKAPSIGRSLLLSAVCGSQKTQLRISSVIGGTAGESTMEKDIGTESERE